MDEHGEFHSIYVWPAGHEDGQDFPEGFWEKLGKALDAVGIDWETT